MVTNLENEIWKPIVGYESLYEVSNMGRIKSLQRFNKLYRGGGYWREEKILMPILFKRGYVYINLHKDNISKTIKIHRIVAAAFIANTENKYSVNHKNGIKSDNRIENLEWATYSEQQKHAYSVLNKKTWTLGIKAGEHPSCKKVRCDTLDITFPSATEAAKILGGTITDIVNYINGKRKHRYGLVFRYI